MRLPITIKLKPSRTLLLGIGLAYLAAMLVVGLLPLPLIFRLGFVVALLAAGYVSLLRLGQGPFAALHLGNQGEMLIEQKVGGSDTATVHPQTLVMPGLIVLLLRVKGKFLALPLPTDAIGRAAHRQLRIWLRWRAATA